MSELPQGWASTTLGVLGRYVNGRAFKPSEWSPSGRPIIRIQNLTGSSEKINFFDGPAEDRYLVDPGDLLVSWSATLGAYLWRGPQGVLNQHIFRVESHIDKHFHKYLVDHVLRDLQAKTHGSGMVHITRKPFNDHPVGLPPLAEQERIVAAIDEQFSRIDAGVAALERVRQNLKRMRAAVVNAALRGTLTDAWRSRSNHPARPGLIAAGLPPSWQRVNWGSVLSREDGAFKRGPFGSALKKEIFVSSGYKVYEQYCAINDDCSFARYYIPPAKFKELERFAVRAGDFLISCSGVTLGRITQVPGEFEEGVINQALLRVRLDPAVIPDGFFKMLFRSPQFQAQIKANSIGTAIPNVKGVKDLKAIPLPLPPIDEQDRIVSAVEDHISELDGLERILDTAVRRGSACRSSILAAAFSGQLRTQDPNDEPALLLLDRISTERASSNGHGRIRSRTSRTTLTA